MGFAKVRFSSKKKTGLERAFEDIENGRITFVNGLKKNKLNVSEELLVWKQDDTELTLLLTDTGTHSDLFG